MAIVAKRTVMSLFSDPRDPYSHQVRIVLAEKGVNVDIQPVDPEEIPEALLEANPYGNAPTLIDRELSLFESRIIMEYLDERFPHPPLLPVYPVSRAESRKMMHRIERDWYSLLPTILHGKKDDAALARKELRDSIIGLEPVFADKPFFLSDEFTLVDCCLAPLFWRLPLYGIEVPPKQKAIHAYMERVFERPSFQASLTELERELRAA